jgi:hypothetical protein
MLKCILLRRVFYVRNVCSIGRFREVCKTQVRKGEDRGYAKKEEDVELSSTALPIHVPANAKNPKKLENSRDFGGSSL